MRERGRSIGLLRGADPAAVIPEEKILKRGRKPVFLGGPINQTEEKEAE